MLLTKHFPLQTIFQVHYLCMESTISKSLHEKSNASTLHKKKKFRKKKKKTHQSMITKERIKNIPQKETLLFILQKTWSAYIYMCAAKWMYFRRNILWKAVLLHVLPLKWFFVFTILFKKKKSFFFLNLTLCTKRSSYRWVSLRRTCSMFTSLISLYFLLLNRVLNFKTKKLLLLEQDLQFCEKENNNKENRKERLFHTTTTTTKKNIELWLQ